MDVVNYEKDHTVMRLSQNEVSLLGALLFFGERNVEEWVEGLGGESIDISAITRLKGEFMETLRKQRKRHLREV